MWRRKACGQLHVTHLASPTPPSCLPRPLHWHVSPMPACSLQLLPARLWHPHQGWAAAGQQGGPGGEAITGGQALTLALPQGLALTRARALSSGLPPLQLVSVLVGEWRAGILRPLLLGSWQAPLSRVRREKGVFQAADAAAQHSGSHAPANSHPNSPMLVRRS